MTRDEFLKLNPVNPYRSKLEPFWEDIVELRKAGMPYSSIVKFLAINGVEVTTAGLSDYVRRHAIEDSSPVPSSQPKSESTKPHKEVTARSQLETRPSKPLAPDVFELSKKPEVDMSFDD